MHMVQTRPRDAESHGDAARRLHRNRRHAAAAAAAHAHLSQFPEDGETLALLADASLAAGYVAEAEKVYRHMLTRARSLRALIGCAAALSARGDMAAAGKLLREAIAADPANPRAWTLLAEIHRFRRDDPLIARAKRQLRRDDLAPIARRDLNYALCKAMNDLGKWTLAWDFAARGAEAAAPVYDPSRLRGCVAEQKRVFDRGFLAPRPGRGASSAAPVFVVGMMRSGTTLTERILGAHPGVAGLGELPFVLHAVEDAARDDAAAQGGALSEHAWVRRWSDQAFTALAETCLADAARRAGGELPPVYVDKMPVNLLFLGEIALMFPKARIVRLHRDPLDTCVSCYLGRFGVAHPYTYRTDWLAEAHQLYQAAGDHAAGVIPNPVLDLHYEALVTDPAPEIRRLLDFLDLPWDPACLTPERHDSAILSRSRAQARRPISAGSVGRWRRYGDRVAPLAAALGARSSDGAAPGRQRSRAGDDRGLTTVTD